MTDVMFSAPVTVIVLVSRNAVAAAAAEPVSIQVKKTITPGHLGMFGMALVGVTCTAEVYISAFEQCDYCTGCIHRVEVKSSVWCLSVCPFHDPCASVQEVVTLSCYWCPDVASLHFEPFIRGLIYLLVKVVHLKSEAGGQAVYTHTHTPI